MSIQDIVLKIKGGQGIRWVLLSIIGIMGVAGGYFSYPLVNKPEIAAISPVQILYPPQPVITTPSSPNPPGRAEIKPTEALESKNGSFIGSKTGKTYYPKGCGGINRIKPENRVYFISQHAAESAGYSRTKTCSTL